MSNITNFFYLRRIYKAIFNILLLIVSFSAFVIGLIFVYAFLPTNLVFSNIRNYYEKNCKEVINNYEKAENISFLNQKNDFLININLEEMFDVIICPSRPDSGNNINFYVVKIKQTNGERLYSLGQKIYLSSEEGKYDFSDSFSSFWIKLQPLNQKNKIRILFEIDKNSLEKEFADNLIFSADIPLINNVKISANASEFEKLQLAKWYGIEGINNNTSDFQRIKIDDEHLKINKNEFLIFKDNRWQKAKEHDSTKDFPIANISCFDEQKLVLTAWDISGKDLYEFSYNKDLSTPIKHNSDFIKNIRLRTLDQISFIIDKQNIVMKTNTFIVCKNGRWRHFLFLPSIDQEDISDIFYLEKIIEKGNEKYIVGKLYNSTRTQYININTLINSNRLSRQHKRLLQFINK